VGAFQSCTAAPLPSQQVSQFSVACMDPLQVTAITCNQEGRRIYFVSLKVYNLKSCQYRMSDPVQRRLKAPCTEHAVMQHDAMNKLHCDVLPMSLFQS
jgi:hypothetical protein